MATDYSFRALMRFLEVVGDKGLMHSRTAEGLRVAVNKIQEDLTEDELADVRGINGDAALRKLANRTGIALRPSTLSEYQRRVARAIQEFVTWSEDPAGYKPKSSGRARRGKAGERVGAGENEKAVTAPSERSSVGDSASANGALSLPYPLRSDFLAQVRIPRDLTTEEARRIGAFIMTLAIDYKPQT